MAISSTSSPQRNRSVTAKNDKVRSPSPKLDEENKSQNKESESVPSSPAKRNNNPGIRLIGGRIYDSHNGKTCHQCRQKTREFAAGCKNITKGRPCPIKFCHKCLLNRYGEKAEEVGVLQDWICPKCRGICNCSFCMKKRGHRPTGILVHAAKENGFSCVSDMLQVKGPMTRYGEKSMEGSDASPRKRAAAKMEAVTSSPRKPGKENTIDGNVNSNSCASPLPSSQVEKKSKRVKFDVSNEINNGSAHGLAEDNTLARKSIKSRGKQEEKCEVDECGSVQKETWSSGGEKKAKKLELENPNGKLDGNILNAGSIQEPALDPEEKKQKNSKRKNLKVLHNGNKNDNAFMRRTSPRNHQLLSGTSKRDAKNKNDGDPQETTQSKAKISMPGFAEFNNKDQRKEGIDAIKSEVAVSDDCKKNDYHGSHVGIVSESLHIDTKDERFQNNYMDVGVVLSQGTELTSVPFTRRTSPRNHQLLNRTSKRDAKIKSDSDPQETKQSKAKISMQFLAEFNDKDQRKESTDVINSEILVSDNRKNSNYHGTQVGTVIESLQVDTNGQRFQNSDMDVDVVLAQGTELTTVHDIHIQPQDVGKALQFLEFCAVFGKVLGVKKEQPECVLKDLIHGRTNRRGKYSVTLQFLINLLSAIQEDRGQTSLSLSPTDGKNSWINALEECISESGSLSKSLELNGLDRGAEGYENLNTSQRLTLLNILCDEVLGTVKIRNWIDSQVSKAAEKAKEHKERVTAAKDKEKRLKQKIQDEIAKAIIEKNGDQLSISEYDAILSEIKREAARAHTEVLESIGFQAKHNESAPDAVRTEAVYLGTNGCAYWRLNCMSNKSDLLRQDIGTGDTTASDQKWFALEEEQKEILEKHINSLRGKLLRAKRVQFQQQFQSNGNC